jgi:dsDNA-specific endonuclease/ATPase MutS2
MANLNDSILSLQEKLTLLLKRFAQLEKENQQLKAALVQQKESTQLLEKQLKDEQAQWAASMVNKANMDPAEKEKWVKKIDQYIKEIDASIKNLNP